MTKDYPDWHLGILWLGQYEAVHPTPIWAALEGQEKMMYWVGGSIIDGAYQCMDPYTVPEGKVLYLYGFGGTLLYTGSRCVMLRKNGTTIVQLCDSNTVLAPGVPIVYRAGDTVEVCVVNRSGQDNIPAAFWWGWEV